MRVELKGLQDVVRRLNRLDRTLRGKILRKAVTRAVQPITKDAKRRVPVDTGWLRRSLGYKLKGYRSSGVVVGIIGPRTGYQTTRKRGKTLTAFGQKLTANTWKRPTRYSHLVEFGTYRTRAKPFLQTAWRAGRAQAEATLAAEIAAGIAAAARG